MPAAALSLADLLPIVSYTIGGVASTGPFAVPFALPTNYATALKVAINGIETADWTFAPDSDVAGGYPTGEVTLTYAQSNCTVTIWRRMPLERTADFGNGPLDISGLNSELAYIVMRLQDAHLRAAMIWHTGSGAPSASLGADGDMYIDTATGDLYGPKDGGAWGASVANLTGPTGPGGGAADVAAHVALADPHTQYVLENAIGVSVAAYSALVAALAASAPSAGDLWFAASATTVSKQASTAFGRGLLNLEDAAALRSAAAAAGTGVANDFTLDGGVRMANNKAIQFKDSGGTVNGYLYLDASNVLTLQSAVVNGTLRAIINGGSAKFTVHQQGGAEVFTVGYGGAVTITDTLTLANSKSINFKSSGGSSFSVLYVYSDDNVYIDQQITGKDVIFRGPSFTEIMRLSGATRLQMAKPVGLKPYTVAGLPAGAAGDSAFASNGRAYNGAGTLEGAGAGTGVAVIHNGTAWKVFGTNQTVQA